MKFQKLNQTPSQFLQNSGWNWTTDDHLPYISDELIQVTEKEADDFYKAAGDLYEMYIKAAEWVIKNKQYDLIGIPKNLIPLIEHTWEHDENWHLYGRFDLAGGLDGKPIKLIEFNADTATCIPETAIIQWASLMANGFSDNLQFNSLFESLTNSFTQIRELSPFSENTILFSSMKGFPEDETNVTILMEAAKNAGFVADFEYVENLEFSKTEGLFKEESNGDYTFYPIWFKLIPWEFIASDEPELLEILTELVLNKKLTVLNPAYTLVFQSKGLLKVLWDLFPHHPLLLETKFEPIYGQKSVRKVFFGREGANVSFISSYGTELTNSKGEYESENAVYQAFTDFNRDSFGNYYQAGVFFSSEPCALGFRKGDEIIDNKASFCGHIIL